MMESQESALFNYLLFMKIHPAIPTPWQVKHERNIETGIMFFDKFVLTFFS